MHQIEPFWKWRSSYIAQEDELSPLYGYENNEFAFDKLVYNYYIHPQWDDFGSSTLYLKVIFVDYYLQTAVIEFMGEWNDAIENDIMYLKTEIINPMINQGINKFVLIGENILNFHASDNCYYEEWSEDIDEHGGWVVALNFRDHVLDEMESADIQQFIHIHERFSDVDWRKFKPELLVTYLDDMLLKRIGV